MMMDDTTTVRVSIFDTEHLIDDADTVNVIPVKTSGTPLVISTIDDDRDKFKPIKSKQARIQLVTQSGITFSTFSDSSDNRWYVEIITGQPKTLFKGYLSLADMLQDFLPNPQILELTATDHLGMLKDIPLTDFDGENPITKNKISKYLAWALSKTGLSLPLNVVNNLRHGTGARTESASFSGSNITIAAGSDMFYEGQRIIVSGTTSNNGFYTVTAVTEGAPTTVQVADITFIIETASATFTDESSQTHFYDTAYLDAKTFEDKIGTCEDCYSVLEKILGEDCFITQYLGEWWIFRIDEWDNNDIYVSVFDTNGDFDSNEAATTYNKSIGRSETIKPLADRTIEAQRPVGIAKETFNYRTPLEVPSNKDFSRGVVIDDVLPEKTYTVEGWKLREGAPGFYGSVDGTTATIHKIYNDLDYEEERYVVLTPRTSFETSSINDITYLESEAIPIHEKDRFTASVSWKLASNIGSGSGSYRLMRVVLKGNDGTWWILGEDTDGNHTWYNTLAWSVFTAKGQKSLAFTDPDETKWSTLSWDAPAAPVSGSLYIWLNQFNQITGSGDDVDIWYSSLRFEYMPYINGSYQEYTGQYQKITRSPDLYLAKRDNEVSIGDSPKPLFRGAMFIPTYYDEIFLGTITFGTGTAFSIPGDYTNTLVPGMIIRAAAVLNDVTATITSVTYHVIGNTTEVQINADTVAEIAVGVVSEAIFQLTSRFYPANVFPSGPPDITYVHPYGEVQIRSVFNQFKRHCRILNGGLKNLTPTSFPDLIWKYSLTDSNSNLTDRFFMLMSFEQNWKSGLWVGTFVEVYHQTGKTYTEDREFKYIS